MRSRGKVEQLLSDLKYQSSYGKAFNRCTIAISSLSLSDIINAFTALPCLLDTVMVHKYCEKLVQLTKSINTISYDLDTGKPSLVKQTDNDVIEYCQRELIYEVCYELASDLLHIKPSIKMLFDVQDKNVSKSSIVCAIVMNMLGAIANMMASRCAEQDLDFDNRTAVCNALVDQSRIQHFVHEAIDQMFLANLKRLEKRETFCNLVTRAKEEVTSSSNTSRANLFIEEGKKKLESKEAGLRARAFDTYPDLIDADLLKQFAKEYIQYITRINPASLVYSEAGSHPIALRDDCEDSHYLEEFERQVIQIGILDLLDHAQNVTTEVKHAIEVLGNIDSVQLVNTYVSAANQSIIILAHKNLEDQYNNISDKEMSVWDSLNGKRGAWVLDVLHHPGHPLPQDEKRLKAEKIDTSSSYSAYYPGIGITTLAVTVVGLFAAGAAYAFSSRPQQPKVNTLAPQVPPTQSSSLMMSPTVVRKPH